jgi:hypothetical protein
MVISTDPAAVIAGHSASEDARERAYNPAIHPLRLKRFFSMDARVKSAFTRVFRRAMPAHDQPGQWLQSKA